MRIRKWSEMAMVVRKRAPGSLSLSLSLSLLFRSVTHREIYDCDASERKKAKVPANKENTFSNLCFYHLQGVLCSMVEKRICHD